MKENKLINKFKLLATAIACAVPHAVSAKALARAGADDCSDFSDDIPLAGESLNDAASYDFPEHWRDWWDLGGTSARISAGSLNAREFLYSEDLRFEATSNDSQVSLFFDRGLRQNHWLKSSGTELNLNITPGNSGVPSFSVLMDSDAIKKNADLGLAIGWRQSLVDYSEFFFWSIDHYYNTKETSAARWIKKPFAWGYRFSKPRPESSETPWLQQAQIEIQPKAVYDNPDAGTVCTTSRRSLTLRGKITTHILWNVANFNTEKNVTSKSSAGTATHTKRDSASAAVTWISSPAQSGAGGEYDSVRIEILVDKLERESQAASGLRREAIVSARRHLEAGETGQWFFGIIASRGQQSIGIAEADGAQVIEQAKLQTGFEYQIGRNTKAGRPKGSFRTLANWDLDHLVQDFPYSKRRFRPWDGGLLQFSIYN
ncbi:MAG: hypothetical protein RIQ81_2115 [Pseudomonadota bacterium]|jgi:hypothetical protein